MTRAYTRLVFFALFLGLAGCASVKTEKIAGPDGTENQLISCYQIEDCYKKASEICSGPYKIMNTSSETSGYNGITGTTVKLLIKCGG